MKKIISILILMSVSILVSCQKANEKVLSPQTGVGTGKEIQGPGDGGGGDTCNGKLIESYHIELSKLDEYNEYILPIITSLSEKEKVENGLPNPFSLASSLKNWYLIDCKLDQIPKERKGLYFETDQAAIHTKREVFIDSQHYGKMQKEEKAKLLLHEMVMGFYLMKYLTISEICSVSNSCTSDMAKIDNWKIFRPLTYRSLNEEDHQKIRALTVWLWENRLHLQKEKFAKLLAQYDFDKRVQMTSDTPSKEVEVEVDKLIKMFKKLNWTNSFPQYCGFDSAGKSQSICELFIDASINEKYKTSSGIFIKALVLKLKLIRKSNEKIYEQEFIYPISSDKNKVKLYLSRMGSILNLAPIALFAHYPSLSSSAELKEGQKTQAIFFMIDLSDSSAPTIYQIYYQTYVWYSFETVLEEIKGTKMKTVYGYPAILESESENLFIEPELLYLFPMEILKGRVFITSVPAD